jgi:hypothetical protein
MSNASKRNIKAGPVSQSCIGRHYHPHSEHCCIQKMAQVTELNRWQDVVVLRLLSIASIIRPNKLVVTANIVPSSLLLFTLMMGAIVSS